MFITVVCLSIPMGLLLTSSQSGMMKRRETYVVTVSSESDGNKYRLDGVYIPTTFIKEVHISSYKKTYKSYSPY